MKKLRAMANNRFNYLVFLSFFSIYASIQLPNTTDYSFHIGDNLQLRIPNKDMFYITRPFFKISFSIFMFLSSKGMNDI